MSNRYPPARGRSPPRYDRRPSATQFPPSSQRDPPRGPKADFRGGGSFPVNSAPRGRGGFPARASETWDRDRERDRDRDRDGRPPQSYRGREDDRPEWSRRERDFPPADRPLASARDSRPYVGRERSASPVRSRRGSRDSIPSTFSRPLESASTYYAPAARGGLSRGRGRGDWDRGRGRNSFVGDRERDLFHPRSRSRDSWRDRDFDRGRPPPGDVERPVGFERRNFDRSVEREVRPRDAREHDIWQRDPSPVRASNQNAASSVGPPTPSIADRLTKPDIDIGRRASVVATPTTSSRDNRRDGDPPDYFSSSRLESSRRDPPQSSQQPAAVIGLDYGPPPSLPPATTPSAEKPSAPLKPQTSKTELVAAPATSFQPPSGPKAGRSVNAASLNQNAKASVHQDNWLRSESFSRPNRPNLASGANLASENLPRKEEPLLEPRSSGSMPMVERSMPPNVPSGPRLGHPPPYKQRLPSTEPSGTIPSPPTTRDNAKPLSLSDNRAQSIPTGPRLDRELSKPLTNTAPAGFPARNERPAFIPTGPRQLSMFPTQPQKPRPAFGISVPAGPKALAATSPRVQENKMTLLPPRKPSNAMQSSGDVEMSTSASSADEDEPEDDSFDEEYFAESEERHKQEMRLLESRKPPPLLEDPVVVAMLVKLQFLQMISCETAPRLGHLESQASKGDIPTAVTVSTDVPSPDATARATKHEAELSDARRRPLKAPLVNPIPTPPIDSLPYLGNLISERLTFEESDTEVEHEAVAILLQQEFEREAWDLRAELDEKHAEFKLKYSLWKQEINYIEQERREQQVSPAPASPAPSAAPSVTPSLTHERTRGARNTTEADLEAALLLSKQSAKEEEERREREAAAISVPNYETEAVIPPMMTTTELESWQFEDTNNLIPLGLVYHKYAFWPPKDDFTEEEQAQFITAYCQNPKKWSKIAESIPDRTYQDCIAHYYLTKDHTRYKEIFKRSQPRKRGRGKGANKPRSTALMSELLRNDDAEGTPIAMTDSGRPRRAAAPTFGDAPSEVDPSTPVPPFKKLTAALSNPETTVTKPSRGRKTGSGTKPRRTKAQIQADQQQAMLLNPNEASPGRPMPATKTERGRAVLRAGEPLPAKTDVVPLPQPQRLVDTVLQQYPVSDVPNPPPVPQPASAATAAVTSYWSVPEQHKFPELLSYFGRDFAAIADFMKTKSVTMIKNYYLRQINDGKDEFEKIAQIGEQRRLAGGVVPRPPSPIAPAKRRYDTTPATAPAARPLAPTDPMTSDSDSMKLPHDQQVPDEFPQSNFERITVDDAIAKPRTIVRDSPRERALSGSLVAKQEDATRFPNERIPLFGQKQHGPRAGFFQDDAGSQAPRQNYRQLQERSPQILAQRPPEMARNELVQQASLSGMPQILLGARESLAQTVQRIQVPPTPLIQALQSQGEKYAQPSMKHPGHSRNNSLVNSSYAKLEQAQDLPVMRRMDSQRSLFGVAVNGSPALAPATTSLSHVPRMENLQPNPPAPAAPDPVKPPAKRSNLFGLLNDDPPEPPPKRPSLETPKRTSILSPQIAPVHATLGQQQQHHRGQPHNEDALMSRGMRGPYSHSHLLSGALQSSTEFSGLYASTPPVTAPSHETWIDRFDPRTQRPPPEQHRHSPISSHYSVVPPASQGPSLHSLRVEGSRGLERHAMDHRRALNSLNQVPLVPSPPPQQANQPAALLRSASSSSQHSRGPSLGYPGSQQTSQSSSLGHPSGPPNHPQSASSTPVSSLHHRAQSSIDIPARLTIQQHMAQQTQGKQHDHHQHERHIQRQREMELAAQRDREREREHQQQHMRRDIYGLDSLPNPVSRQNQVGTTANQSHMAFAQREIPRTFTSTPPQSHGHSHSHSHSQFVGSAGHGPGGLGPAQGLQHPHQLSLQHQGGTSTLHLQQRPHHQQAPPGQTLHPGGQPGHFRTLSQDGRREERR